MIGQKHQQELARHNHYRAKHHAQPLVLSGWLCNYAQQWADYLANTGQFDHSSCNVNGKSVGENIYQGYGNVNGG